MFGDYTFTITAISLGANELNMLTLDEMALFKMTSEVTRYPGGSRVNVFGKWTVSLYLVICTGYSWFQFFMCLFIDARMKFESDICIDFFIYLNESLPICRRHSNAGNIPMISVYFCHVLSLANYPPSHWYDFYHGGLSLILCLSL